MSENLYFVSEEKIDQESRPASIIKGAPSNPLDGRSSFEGSINLFAVINMSRNWDIDIRIKIEMCKIHY